MVRIRAHCAEIICKSAIYMLYFDTVLIRKDVRKMLEIREVKTKADLKKYVTYPNKLYKDVPQYMPPLVSEVFRIVFSREEREASLPAWHNR